MLCTGTVSTQLLLDIADFIYIAVDVNQNVSLINKKGCEILGYSEDEIIGKNWFDNFLPKEVAKDIKSNFVKRITENKKTELARSYPILTKEGEERLISWHGTFFNDEKGDLSGVLCSGEEITEKIEVQRALKDSEAKYSSVVESSNDGIAITQEGKLVFVNKQFAEMLDYSPEDLFDLEAADVVSDADRDAVLDYTQRRIAGDKTIPNKYEISLVTSKGIEIPIEITASVIEYKGKPASVSILRDITERKEAQKALEESERKFRKIFNHSNDGYVLRKLDGTILEANPKFLELFGYNRDEVISENILDLRLMEDSKELSQLMRKVGKKGFIQVETEVQKKDGTFFPIQLNGITFDLEGEQVVFNILTDLTESKKNVSALIENEKKYRILLESLPQKIFHKDVNLKYISCNENLANDLNIQPSDIKGKTDFNFFTSELAEKYRAEDKRIMKEGKIETIEEKTVKNGKEYTSETTKIPLYDEKGESVGVIGIYNDISDRVKIEQDLQESEEKYRSFVQNFNGIAFKGTLDFQPIFFHGAVEEITGYTEEEFISKSLSWDKIIHPEDFEKLIDSREKLKTTTNFFTDIDYRIIRKNGEIRWINEIIGNSCDENGKPIHVQGCIHDHTERKVIEEKIKENEEKFRILYNEMEQAYALYEAIYDKKGDIEDGILVEVNSEYEKLVNKKREEIIGKKITEIYPNLKKQENNPIAVLGRTSITGETVISEYYNKDIGKWLLAKSFSPMKNHAAILFEDITEKRKMERELEKERKATQQYLDIVNIILTVIDANENVILVNKKGCELLGYEQKDIIGKNWFDNFLPKRVRDKTKEVYQELMAGKITQSESRENLVLTKDGEERLIAWDNTYIKDEEGTIVSTLSSGRDITEIRKTQRELKESEIRFKGIFNHSNDGYVLRTVDGIVLEANPRFLELFGREYSEVISNNIRMINVYETDEDHISRKKEIDEKGYAQFETLATRKDGSLFPMEVNAIKLLLADEELVFVIIRDITERKKTEEKIKSSEALYKALFDNTGTAMMLAEKDFTIALVNKLFLEKSGLSQDELLGKKWTDFIQKTERENIMKTIKRMGTDFTPPITFETSEFGILGENKTLLITIGINPETSQSIASLIDITGMKELEKELSKSEEKYRVLFNNVPVALSQTKPSGEIVECNSAFLDIFGYKNAEELKKIKIEELYFDPSEREAVLAVKDEVGYHDSLLQKMKKKDNTPIWVEINSKTSYDENHNVSHYDTSLKDVTEKKEMEARLKQSEEKFRSIFNHSVDGYILRDDDGTVMEYNPKLLEIFGYRVEDLDGVDGAKFDMRENIDDLQKIREMLASKGHAFLETKFMKKDKTWISTEVSAIKFDLDGRDVVFSILRDISKRKKTEEELITSEERLRTLFENIPLAISTHSSDGELVDINPAFLNLYGYNNKDDCFSTPFNTRWFNIKDRERFYDSLRQRNYVKNFEAKHYKKDESEFWVSITAVAQPDISGEKKHFNSLRDITIEKQREDELKRQTLRYHLKESQLYLSEEERPYISKEAFIELLKVGYNGLVLSRLPETEWKKDTKYEFDFLRLAEKGHLKTISSDLSKIEQLIEELPNKHVIVIDRFDYLISKNGFETTLFFIFRLIDIAYLSNHIIIVSLNPVTINEKERKSLRKEMQMIESLGKTTLPEELIEILEFVHKRNIAGDKPSYTDIVETFSISRPTARKRIKNLINEEFIFESTKGRSKVLGITEKGKIIFN